MFSESRGARGLEKLCQHWRAGVFANKCFQTSNHFSVPIQPVVYHMSLRRENRKKHTEFESTRARAVDWHRVARAVNWRVAAAPSNALRLMTYDQSERGLKLSRGPWKQVAKGKG